MLVRFFQSDEFYDFDAKYYNSESKTLVDPPMPENMREQIREDAVKSLWHLMEEDFQELISS